MASLRTEITEIVTGLGMLGLASVDEALAARPSEVVGVEHHHYEKLIAARADDKYGLQFEEAWANGVAFAAAAKTGCGGGSRSGWSGRGRTRRPPMSRPRLT